MPYFLPASLSVHRQQEFPTEQPTLPEMWLVVEEEDMLQYTLQKIHGDLQQLLVCCYQRQRDPGIWLFVRRFVHRQGGQSGNRGQDVSTHVQSSVISPGHEGVCQ